MNGEKIDLFPAKILLFGEYSVILNSSALAIPFNNFSGRLLFPHNHEKKINTISNSNLSLKNLYNYCYNLKMSDGLMLNLNLKHFFLDINEGLYFESDIPQKYGIGSSGSLSAAIYNRYMEKKLNDVYTIKSTLAKIESHFHGKSSGMDSLVSYIQKPISIINNQIIILESKVEPILRDFGTFLINTCTICETSGFVNEFLYKYNNEKSFQNIIDNNYIPYVNGLIDSFLKRNMTDFFLRLKEFVSLQYLHFYYLFPNQFLDIAMNGNKNDMFYLKLCGSGGGGFLLGFTNKIIETENYFKNLKISITFI
jgi:mevalonate kinase